MSKNLDKNLIKNLEILGLSEKEAMVYIDLLQREEAVGSSKIVHNTALHGQYVYDALYALENKGLIRHSVINGRKKFEANAASRISNLLEEKKIATERSIEALELLSKKPLAQEFEVYQGENAYIQRQFDSLKQMPEGGEILVISTNWGDLFTKSRPDFFYEFEKLRKQKNISVRFILNESLRKQANMARIERFKTDFRFIPEYSSNGGFCVYHDCVDFYLFGAPIVVFSFKNIMVSGGYKNFFEVLWGMGQK